MNMFRTALLMAAMTALFSTYPQVEERISRLSAMAGGSSAHHYMNQREAKHLASDSPRCRRGPWG